MKNSKKMRLFHYTSIENALQILHCGKIAKNPKNACAAQYSQKYEPLGVWLTTDSSPSGHGLPDGRRLSAKQAANTPFKEKDKDTNCWHCLDHTTIRIELELHPRCLVSSKDLFEESNLRNLEIAAYLPMSGVTATEEEYLAVAALVISGQIQPKSKTWYVALVDIDLAPSIDPVCADDPLLVSIAIRQGQDYIPLAVEHNVLRSDVLGMYSKYLTSLKNKFK